MKTLSLALATAVALSTSYAVAHNSDDHPGWVGVFGEYYNPDNNKPEPIGYLEDGNGLGIEAGWRFDEKWAVRAEIARDFLGRKKSRLAGRDADDEGNRYGADILYFVNDSDLYVFTGLKHQDLQGQRTLLDIGLGKHWRLAEHWKGISEVAAYQDLDESLLDFGLKLGVAYEFGFAANSAAKAISKPAVQPLAEASDQSKQAAAEVQEKAAEKVAVVAPAVTAVVDQDSDNDGVLDGKDQCANTPAEDKVDANGCSIFTEQEVSISLKVNFTNNSAVVTNPNDPQFAEFVGFMQRFPQTAAVIEGHSSAGGAASYNLKLSQQRADAVRTLLIEQYDMKASRLSAKGYGETRLLDTSGTAAAAKRNRRIEVKVTATQVTKEQK